MAAQAGLGITRLKIPEDTFLRDEAQVISYQNKVSFFLTGRIQLKVPIGRGGTDTTSLTG